MAKKLNESLCNTYEKDGQRIQISASIGIALGQAETESFEKLYDSVYKEYPGYEIYTVFGCPGDKALNRRRDLGLISGLFSNRVYLTTDDPGTESVSRISEETGHYVEMVGCP